MSFIVITDGDAFIQEIRTGFNKINEKLDSLLTRMGKVENNMARVDEELESLRTLVFERLADAEAAARAAEDALRTALENDAVQDAEQAAALTATLDNSAADKIAALRSDISSHVVAPATDDVPPPGDENPPADGPQIVVDQNPPGTGT